MKSVRIGHRQIGPGDPTFIIAEAGVNHNGRLSLARKLIDAAAAAGADAIKFQTFRPEQVVLPTGKMAAYQKKNVGREESQLEMIQRFVLPEAWYPRLMRYAAKRRIIFFSAPHGSFDSVRFLAKLHVPAFKIGSGDLPSTPLLRFTARYKRPMIISTGMATMSEIRAAIKAIHQGGNRQIIILQCTTNYPTAANEVNLRAMQTIAKTFRVPVGFSDHTTGCAAALAAVALGAAVIEKHLTLDRHLPGPDHIASAEPAELKKLIRQIRQVELMLGDGRKRPQASERAMAPLVRRSVVTTRAIRRGQRFTTKNIELKRPGTGLTPATYDRIVGRRARRDVPANVLIKHQDYATR